MLKIALNAPVKNLDPLGSGSRGGKQSVSSSSLGAALTVGEGGMRDECETEEEDEERVVRDDSRLERELMELTVPSRAWGVPTSAAE